MPHAVYVFTPSKHDRKAVAGSRRAGVERLSVRPLQPCGHADPDTPIKVNYEEWEPSLLLYCIVDTWCRMSRVSEGRLFFIFYNNSSGYVYVSSFFGSGVSCVGV